MNSTTTLMTKVWAQDVLNLFLQDINKAQLHDAQLFWSALLVLLARYWLPIVGFLLFMLLVAIAEALMGRWGMLGSILYHYLYYSILFIVGLIWGSSVFVSDFYHEACTLILYPICYFVTGVILDKFNLRKRRRW